MTEQPEPDELERVRRETARKVALEAIAATRAVLAEQRKGREEAGATFTCAVCDETFDKEWTDEEALAEADDLFGDQLGDDPAVVCDDCFNRMGAAVPMRSWAESARASGPMETPTQEPKEQK